MAHAGAGPMIGIDGLNTLAEDKARHRVTIADIMNTMGYGGVMMLIVLIVLFASPKAVPAPSWPSRVCRFCS